MGAFVLMQLCEIKYRTPRSLVPQNAIGRSGETLLDCAALMYGGIPQQFLALRIRLSDDLQ